MAFKTGGRKCKFESLETRQMMAGDVVGNVRGGTLTLKGDNFDNAITITAGVEPNSIVVTGVPSLNGTNTNVNGIPNTGMVFLGVTKGLTVKLGAGNDEVEIFDVTINEKTKIDMGRGVNTVTIDDSTFCKSLDIRTGRDADTVTITDSTVTGKANIRTGRDCDHVTLEDSVFGELNVKLDEDNDTLVIENVTVTRKSSLDGGKGFNPFNEGISNFYGGYLNKRRLAGGHGSI